MNFRRILAGTAASALLATGLVACSDSESDTESDALAAGDTIRVGTTDVNLPEWDVFQDLVEADGIDMEIVAFSDYNTPNDALAQGEIDVNKFQHLLFLNDYNTKTGSDLVPTSATEIYPLALFWQDHDSIDGIEGETVAIPNDATNQGRAINVLVQAGLITLKEEGLLNPEPADIDTDASEVTVTPVDAAQTTTVFFEGTPAVINNAFVGRAEIDPLDAIFQDDPSTEQAEPYINAWVTTPENADNETIQRLAELWKDPSVTEAILESSGNTAVKVDRTREELDEIMVRLQDAQ
ncbi:MetQ/NlpA family ABC transporter substrate-binding protein [Corynebacterium alimapuense]|uniref:Methionine ABC transporter substrate-binding protein n=1 Tax=Corynebacterium alimapuense TaxID=1576874 RepID=A0A3M8K8M8_9CORY|nr:MetQ/NlpA family ABC transporter substrate-binding protein [Corynebacterium alimapuense]RNE48818.1 methionine ABC transporter substrate-binding protein [Corynebacterium alimapuense]